MEERNINTIIHNQLINSCKRQKLLEFYFTGSVKESMVWQLLPALILITVLTSSSIVVEGNQQGTSFSIRPILPENQERESSTFFDLRVEPGHEQSLEIQVLNHTNETIKIAVSVYTATTNVNGFPEYQLKSEKPDSTLPFLVEDIVTVPPYIEVSPYGTYCLPIQVRLPEVSYEGVLAGGIEMKLTTDKEPISRGIRNVYSFVTVILLHQGVEVEPKIISNGTEVAFINGECVFATNFQNTKGAFTKALEIQSTIVNEENNEVIYSDKVGDMQMVPHSNFDYKIQLDEGMLSRGIYIIHHSLKSGEMKWSFREHIELIGETDLIGHSIFREEVFYLEQKNDKWFILGFIMIINIVFVGFWINQSRNHESFG